MKIAVIGSGGVGCFYGNRLLNVGSLVSATDAKTGEKFVVHARSEHEPTVELARRFDVDLNGYVACRDGRRV